MPPPVATRARVPQQEEVVASEQSDAEREADHDAVQKQSHDSFQHLQLRDLGERRVVHCAFLPNRMDTPQPFAGTLRRNAPKTLSDLSQSKSSPFPSCFCTTWYP